MAVNPTFFDFVTLDHEKARCPATFSVPVTVCHFHHLSLYWWSKPMQVHQKLFTVFKLGWCFSWFAHPFKKDTPPQQASSPPSPPPPPPPPPTTTTTTTTPFKQNLENMLTHLLFPKQPEQLLSQSCEVLFHICWFRLFDLSLCSSIPQLENKGTNKNKLEDQNWEVLAPSKALTSVTLFSILYIYVYVINIVRKHW